jgi:transposase
MIALLKYGSGLPFNRLQDCLGIALPASTQWEIAAETAAQILPAWEELVRHAAAEEVLHNDDTSMRILDVMKEIQHDSSDETFGDRTGFLLLESWPRRRAGASRCSSQAAIMPRENLSEGLRQRAESAALPIQMCDALTRNYPKKLAVILANCLTHARRRFVEAAPNFPGECRHVLEVLAAVYRNDARSKQDQLSAMDRLALNQTAAPR